MYTNNRDAYRQAFFVAWQKYKKKLLLKPFEQQLIEIILLHPEYQHLLENPSLPQQQEFNLEENPFFHMGLHLAVREQIRLDRPQGIKQLYQTLLSQHENALLVEHKMMECLANVLWRSQRQGVAPNEADYLELIKKL